MKGMLLNYDAMKPRAGIKSKLIFIPFFSVFLQPDLFRLESEKHDGIK